MSESVTVDPIPEAHVPVEGSQGETPSPKANGKATVAGETLGAEFAGMDIVVDSEDDIDYDTLAPKALTAAELNAWAESHEGDDQYPVWPFLLNSTSIKLGRKRTAQVRIINLTDRALINSVPVEIRSLVQKLFFSNAGARLDKMKGEAKMHAQMQRMKEVAYAYGCAGFVEPELKLRKEDITDPEKQAWVGSVALNDLLEFVRICEGDDKLASDRLEGFSG